MTTISPDAPPSTLINVFTVAPENQQRLLDLLDAATEPTFRTGAWCTFRIFA